MKIEIWSDVVCPWCYIGKRNLEVALTGFEHADQVEIEWRSYELDPSTPAAGRAVDGRGAVPQVRDEPARRPWRPTSG